MAIAIIGAGVAGLSAAIYLSKLRLEVDVYERAPALSAVGSGIMLQPSGMAVLHDLGALKHCLRNGAPVTGVYGTSPLGKRVILNTLYDHWKPGAHGLGIHRSVLLDALYEKAQDAGVRFHFGTEVSDYLPGDAIQLKIDQGWSENTYQALIIASGRGSSLQFKAPIAHSKRPYAWGALWATVEAPASMAIPKLRQWYRESRQMFGILPIGKTHKDGKEMCSLFWSQEVDSFAHLLEGDGGLEQWKKQVRLLTGEQANPFLDKIESKDQLVLSSYTDIEMNGWHHENVLAIGDCAHAMSPQLGQGANMALVDASVLDELALSSYCQDSRYKCDWPEIFRNYSAQRREHLSYYQSASRTLTPLFQSDSSIAPRVRDFILWTAKWMPFARKHAATTLVGGRKGWLCNGYHEPYQKVDLYYWDGRKP